MMAMARRFTRWCVFVAALAGATGVHVRAQAIPLEYQVKAAYLFNFLKFVDWPAPSNAGPLTLCVAQPNPFGSALSDLVRGESISGRSIVVRVVGEPDASCKAVFVPRGASAAAYIAAAHDAPVLTVGEEPRFLEQGGIINLILAGGNVRFEIDQQAATRVGLMISSRLLRLAQTSPRGAGAP